MNRKKEKEREVYTKSNIKRSKEDLVFDIFIYSNFAH